MLFLNRITITNFRDITCKIFAKGKESYQIRKLLRRQCILVASGLCLTLLRYYLMDFQGPTFQRVDNPASFEKDWLTRVITYTIQCFYFMGVYDKIVVHQILILKNLLTGFNL